MEVKNRDGELEETLKMRRPIPHIKEKAGCGAPKRRRRENERNVQVTDTNLLPNQDES